MRMKIRHFFGVNGQLPDGRWCYTVPDWGGHKTKLLMYKFMFHVGDPLLNVIIGYEKL